MAKDKLKRWAELKAYSNIIEPKFEEVFRNNHSLKGKWGEKFFKNINPIVLELGCGKGEYTINLAKKFPEKNFLGIDIKGARIWKGCKEAYESDMKNVGFLRTRIELIESFFMPQEVDEIWITFPDPQLKKRRNKKRLSSSFFLNSYHNILRTDGLIHLKTDSLELFTYTLELLKHNNINPKISISDLYSSDCSNELYSIKTYYEQIYLNQEKSINYICFSLKANMKITEPPDKE